MANQHNMVDSCLDQQNDTQPNSTHVSSSQQQSPTPFASFMNSTLLISQLESEPLKGTDKSPQFVSNGGAHPSNQAFTPATHQLSPLSLQQQQKQREMSRLRCFDIQQYLPLPPPDPLQSTKDRSPLIYQRRFQYQQVPYLPFQRYTPSIPQLPPQRQRPHRQHSHPLQQKQQHSELALQNISQENSDDEGSIDGFLNTLDIGSGVVIPMATKEFECILDYRQNPDTSERQLLIKYKHTSYHHVDWVPVQQIEGEHLGKYRLHSFLKKWEKDGGIGVDFHKYLKLHRVVDEGELVDSETGAVKVYYLCKWNAQLYDQCTWESKDDAERIDGNKVKEFIERTAIPESKLRPSPPRKSLRSFKRYDRSSSYRCENKLYNYQLEGLNWLRLCYYDFKSCILADEMGLGKTVQAIALLDDIYRIHGIKGPFIIIAPLSIIPHWERTFKAWTAMNVIVYRGSAFARNVIMDTEFYYKDQGGNVIENRYKFDVLITTYDMAAASSTVLGNIRWACGVFDEAHCIKNKQPKVGEMLRSFKVDHKLLLTGTPIQNNLDELYRLLNFIQPDIFDNEDCFSDYGSLKSTSSVKKLQALSKSITLRRVKGDVEKSMPIKEEILVEVQLTDAQKEWYLAILKNNFDSLITANRNLSQLRNIMMELQKCCIHPYLLEGAKDQIISKNRAKTPRDVLNCLIQSSGKLILIDKLLGKFALGNHKVLIFTQFTSCLDILSDYLERRKYAYERIDDCISSDQRQASIDRFSTSPINESFVFLLCTRAGGAEINLAAADICIIFDSDWSPQNDLQAQARRHGIGRTQPVQVYRLICANTCESDMLEKVGMKLGSDKVVMSTSGLIGGNAGDQSKKHVLTGKEIEDLLKKYACNALTDKETGFASTEFCKEDIDVILKKHTKVIKYKWVGDVPIYDPGFWEKWAAMAKVKVTRISKQEGSDATANFGHGDDGEIHPWSVSERTEYERKMMIFGYGAWQEMKVDFPRRSEKDLKAVARTLMRYVLPSIDTRTDEDKRLVEDIGLLLQSDAQDDVPDDDTIPYKNASQKQIDEFRSFIVDAPWEYKEHMTRNGRDLLLRIQIIHAIRNLILPGDWNYAKDITFPQVDVARPAIWWGANEDRDMMLGIRKHGYQQYLDIRNDRELCFAGKKYLDQEDKMVGVSNGDGGKSVGAAKDSDIDEADFDQILQDGNDDQLIYAWPSNSDIDKRIQIVAEIYLRGRHQDERKRKAPRDDQSNITPCTRQRKRLHMASASLDQVTQSAILSKPTSIDREQQQLMDTLQFTIGQQNDEQTRKMKSTDTDDKHQQNQTMTNSTIPTMTISQSAESNMEPGQQQKDQMTVEGKKDQRHQSGIIERAKRTSSETKDH